MTEDSNRNQLGITSLLPALEKEMLGMDRVGVNPPGLGEKGRRAGRQDQNYTPRHPVNTWCRIIKPRRVATESSSQRPEIRVLQKHFVVIIFFFSS